MTKQGLENSIEGYPDDAEVSIIAYHSNKRFEIVDTVYEDNSLKLFVRELK